MCSSNSESIDRLIPSLTRLDGHSSRSVIKFCERCVKIPVPRWNSSYRWNGEKFRRINGVHWATVGRSVARRGYKLALKRRRNCDRMVVSLLAWKKNKKNEEKRKKRMADDISGGNGSCSSELWITSRGFDGTRICSRENLRGKRVSNESIVLTARDFPLSISISLTRVRRQFATLGTRGFASLSFLQPANIWRFVAKSFALTRD